MGKKKNDFEASGSGTKKEERPGRVPLPVTIGRLMHAHLTPCDTWRDVHMPGGWRLSYRRVPVPPVPTREPDRTAEIRRRRRYLPPDLRADQAYAIGSESWRTYLSTERDRRRRAGFMGDRDFPFDRPPPTCPRRQQAPTRRDQASTRAQYNDDHDYDDNDDYIEALAYHNKEVKDDSDDYVAVVFQEWQQAMAEGRKFDFPENMTDDEMAGFMHVAMNHTAPAMHFLP
nr:uncharacterized protein LOC127346821 [Lolium perenne]